jgi:hypothetical protein
MTETHANFLRLAGAIVVVICTTENVVNYDPSAFEQQARFAYDVHTRVSEDKSLAAVPVIVLLITNGEARQQHEDGLRDFPALVTCNNYTTSALANAVRVMFGTWAVHSSGMEVLRRAELDIIAANGESMELKSKGARATVRASACLPFLFFSTDFSSVHGRPSTMDFSSWCCFGSQQRVGYLGYCTFHGNIVW